MTSTALDEIRSKALNELDRAKRHTMMAVIIGGVFEAVCLLGLLTTMNLKDPLHKVILFSTGLIYLPLVMGLIALGTYVNRCTLRTLIRLDDFKE